MVRTSVVFLGLLIVLSSFVSDSKLEITPNSSFLKGEVLSYRVHYGFINAGEGTMQVNPKIQEVNGKPCYKINVFGKSVGAFAMMLRVKDNWRSYVDTTTMQPEKTFRNIQEGNYRLKETIFYKKEEGKINVHTVKKNKDPKEKEYKVPVNVHDIVSGYYYLRNIDYTKLHIGEIIELKAFFEDTFYDFKIRYAGKDVVRTKFGKMNAIKLVPIMPDNTFFDGEESIRVWLSDDKNKIPLKLQADMFIGSVELDLKGYKNLREPLNKATR